MIGHYLKKFLAFGVGKGLKLDPEEQFAPKKMQRLAKEYVDSLGLGEGLKCQDALEKYMKADLSGLSKVKLGADEEGKGGESLSKKLNANTDAAKAAKAKLQTAMNVFSTDENSEDAIMAREFKEEIAALNNLILAVPPQFNAASIASYLAELKAKTEAHLEKRYVERKENVENLFKEGTFVTDLKTALNEDDAGIEKIKDDLMKAMEKAHQDELKTFSDGNVNKSMNELHQANRKEFERVATIAKHAKANPKVMDWIRENYESESDDEDEVSLEIHADKEMNLFKKVKMQDLIDQGFLKTTGSWGIMQANIRATPDGGIGIKLNRLFQLDDSVMEELTSLCEVVKATGVDSIQLSVGHKDPEKAEEIARKFVEAAMRAGFAPDKITVKVNGEDKYGMDSKNVKKDELFKEGHSPRIDAARQLYEKREATMKEILGNNVGEKADPSKPKRDISELREAVEKGRQAIKQKEAVADKAAPAIKAN